MILIIYHEDDDEGVHHEGGDIDSGTVSLFALTSDLTNSETVAATL